jgi:hypothetical protein
MRNAATLHLDVQLLFITCRLIFSFLLFSYFSLFFFIFLSNFSFCGQQNFGMGYQVGDPFFYLLTVCNPLVDVVVVHLIFLLLCERFVTHELIEFSIVVVVDAM